MASSPTLPLELFLIIAPHLDSATLSNLSRTSHTFRNLLNPILKRHQVFRLVTSYLPLGLRHRFLDNTTSFLALTRLSRTSHTVYNALYPQLVRFRHFYLPYYIVEQTNRALSESTEPCPATARIDRCLTATSPRCPEMDCDFLHDVVLANAVDKGCPRVVRVLLDHGFDPNGRSSIEEHDLEPPLEVAIWNQDLVITRLLLERGARRGGWMTYSRLGEEMRKLLREYGVDVWIKR